MEPVALIYLGLSLAVLYLAGVAAMDDWRRFRDLLICGAMLFGLCLLCNLLYVLRAEPDAYKADPGLDMAAAVLVAVLCLRRREWWKYALFACFAVQVAVAVWAWAREASDLGFPSVYGWLSNGGFIVELACVALPGGLHVAARLRDTVFFRRSRRRLSSLTRSRDVAP